MSLRAASLAALLLATACAGGGSDGGGEDHSTMRPGEDCLASGCHAAGSTTTTSFTAAGTVYATLNAAAGAGVGGANVTITDGAHAPIVLTTNAAGNFFTTAAIAYPAAVTVAIGGTTRGMTATEGGCNRCHGPTFRVHVP